MFLGVVFGNFDIERYSWFIYCEVYFRWCLAVIFMFLMNILCTRWKKNDNVGGLMLLIDVVMCMGQDRQHPDP